MKKGTVRLILADKECQRVRASRRRHPDQCSCFRLPRTDVIRPWPAEQPVDKRSEAKRHPAMTATEAKR